MYTLLIVNPASGQGKAAREKRKLLDLVSNMPHVRTEITTGPDDAYNFARGAADGGFDRIVVAGGDGTINRVINGLGDSHIPLGLIPLGTGNVLAHDLGIPSKSITHALKVIQDGHIQDVDLGEANGQRFVLMAGLGLDAHVVDSVSPALKDIIGPAAYMPAAIEQLFTYAPTRFRLVFDEGSEYVTDAYAVLVANCASYAYNVKISTAVVFNDGLLDILVFESTPLARMKLVGQALDAVFQQRIANPDTTYFKAARVRVESDPPVKMQVDGDVCGESGVDIRVLPKALKLIVP